MVSPLEPTKQRMDSNVLRKLERKKGDEEKKLTAASAKFSQRNRDQSFENYLISFFVSISADVAVKG
jgi:hypothetical protein